MRKLFFASILLLGGLAILAPRALAQAILGSANGSNQAVVFPSPGVGLPNPVQNNVPGLPGGALPHGVSYYGSDNALVSDAINGRVFVVQISTATLVDTINVSATWNGAGTIAVAPGLNFALGCGSTSTLAVISGPFTASSTINSVTLPGVIQTYQTEAIVFDPAGRAFVYNTTGISVLDPPYSAIAFTIPASNATSGSIAISPDGLTLLTTDLSSGNVNIYSAPFSSGSTPVTLATGGTSLDGIMVAPDGAHALVVSAASSNLISIAAPFSASSTVETIPLSSTFGSFEDVGISADSQLAIMTGNAGSPDAAFIQAPFTTAGATVFTVNIPGGGRGAGAVRFLPPGLAPGLTLTKSGPPSALPGTNITYTITYGNTGGASAANVIIKDPVPAGTTFVSATNGGTNVAGVVTWNIGTLPPGTTGQTVSFTVNVTATSGTITNSSYTIESDTTPPIPGPPVITTVGAGGPTPTPTVIPPPATPTPIPQASVAVPTLSTHVLALLAVALAAIAFLVLRRQG